MPTPSPFRRSRGARGRRACAALALLGLAAAGCRAPGAKAYNLEQLHDSQGRHERVGALMGDVEYRFRASLGQLVPRGRLALSTKDPRAIKDPLRRCVENLVELRGFEPDDPRVRSLQVEHFARLAVEDPWKLSREASVVGLGRLGVELGLAADPPGPPPAEPADAAAVAEAVRVLTAALRPLLAREPVEDGTVQEAIAAAAAQVEALPLDLQGALRLVRATRVLLQPLRGDARVAPVEGTERHVQRVLVARALRAAWRDQPPRPVGGSDPGWDSPRVRAAAARATVRAYGPQALAELLETLRRPELLPEEEVLVALLGLVEREGLPQDLPQVPEAARASLREVWIDAIYAAAVDHPVGRVRVAAMDALATISGGELTSLRQEDWQAWLRARRAAPPARPAASAALPGRGVARVLAP